jgi:hypothetical protein
MKRKYFIIWIDGLGPSRELIKSIDGDSYEYTNSATQAMRITEKDIPKMKEWMEKQYFADWCIRSPKTFIPTSYAPKGTLHKF